MASKLSFDIDINNQGYVRGMQESSKATKDVQKATEDYLKDFGSLRKQLVGAKKEAQNLAVQFAMLGEAEKNSEFGQELAEKLQVAIEKAAELQDVMADTNDAIKNAASDTAGLDALKETLEIGKDATTAYIGVLGQLTGTENELKKVVSSLAAVQGTFNAVIKTANALQKNSSTMLALQRAGVISLTQAEKISTAATKASTLAIQGLGKAMKALPYVAVAAGVLALGKMFVDFMSKSKSAETQIKRTEKALTDYQQAIKETNQTYNSAFASTFSSLMTKFIKLQTIYKSLKSEFEKTEFLKKYKNELTEVVGATNSIGEADKKLITDTEAVKNAFIERAKAAALYAKLQDLILKKEEARLKAADNAKKNMFLEGQELRGGDVQRYNLKEGEDYYHPRGEIGEGRLTQVGARKMYENAIAKNVENAGAEYDKAIDDTIEMIKASNAKLGNALSGDDIKPQKLKVEVEPSLDFSQWDKALNTQFKEYDKKLKDKLKTFSDKYNAETTKIKLNVDAQLSSPQNIQRALNEISEALKIEPKLDFEIPENMREQIDSQKEQLDSLLDALTIAEERKIEFAKAGDLDGIAAMNEQIQNLTEAYDENTEALDKNIKKAKRIASISEAFNQAGQAVGAFGDMFTALGEATDNAGLKVMGIIAQAIATITLSFAQALTSCKTWVDWLIFGATGMATMITMISQIKNLTAGGYAEGGVVPGTSFTGDKLLARVNSGERILTAQQNENLEKIANTNYNGYQQLNSQTIQVVGKIKGTDILLVSKNTNKLLSKSGTNISF